MTQYRGSITYENTAKQTHSTNPSSYREKARLSLQLELDRMIQRHEGLIEKINELSGYDKEGQPIYARSDDERARLQREAEGLGESIMYQYEVGERQFAEAEAKDAQLVADLEAQLDRQEQAKAKADEIVLQRQAEAIASLKINQGERP